jgi:hypothetical protein
MSVRQNVRSAKCLLAKYLSAKSPATHFSHAATLILELVRSSMMLRKNSSILACAYLLYFNKYYLNDLSFIIEEGGLIKVY